MKEILNEVSTLTGGVADALTTKEFFFEEGETPDLAPRICLAVSTEEVKEDDTKACVAITYA